MEVVIVVIVALFLYLLIKPKSPVKRIKSKEEKQKEIIKAYENFLNVVAKDRNLTIKTLKKYADGKIYIANQVKGILVDKISTLVDTKMAIKKEIAKKEHIAINKIKFYNILWVQKEINLFERW